MATGRLRLDATVSNQEAGATLSGQANYRFGPLSAAAVDACGDGARLFEDHGALAHALGSDLGSAAPTLLVKGSRGSAMDTVVRMLLAQGEGNDAA